MNIDKRALKGVVDEIEASRARQKGETEFQREALKRAVKNHQLDAKAIRIVLQRRAMGETKRDEQDYYVHSYELALGGKKDALEALERGASIREAAKAGGISTGSAASLAKGVQESSFVNGETGEITTAGLDTPPVGSSELSEGHSSAAPDSDATGNSAHEGEGNGHRNDRDGERRGSEELQPERQSGRGRDQGGDGGARHENGKYPRPQQRDGGPRGGGGDHQSPDGQHVVRLGGDEGSLAASRGVDAPSTPPLGAVAEAQPERVARQDDGLDIPPFLRRQRASA